MMASMSPQAADPEIRQALIEAAARVLGEEGPAGLSTRKLAAEVGTSTMAVYTHFGSLAGLVAAVVDEGFARLAAHMSDIHRSEDALADLAQLAMAYRANALDNPHLYAVMFGSASLGGYRRSDAELDERNETFDALVTATRRAMDAGQLAPGDPVDVAGQLWSALHGYVMLELAGFMREDAGAAERVLWPLLANLAGALRAGLTSGPEASDATTREASHEAITRPGRRSPGRTASPTSGPRRS